MQLSIASKFRKKKNGFSTTPGSVMNDTYFSYCASGSKLDCSCLKYSTRLVNIVTSVENNLRNPHKQSADK